MKKIIDWIIRWFWSVPVSKPEPEKPIRLKATEVINEYMVIHYHGQRINLHRNEYKLWKALGRKDKRAMAHRFADQEKRGLIRFDEINGKVTCIKNKDYAGMAELIKR